MSQNYKKFILKVHFHVFLKRIGYDKSCLKKSICEFARHPVHNEDNEEHLLLDIINFILT